MSYEPSTPIYMSAAEHINNQKYNVLIPQSWVKNLPKAYLEGINGDGKPLAPFFDVEDNRVTGHSKITIADMIAVFNDGAELTICSVDDIPEIKLYLDLYLKQVLPFKDSSPDAIQLIDSIAPFYAAIRKKCLRILQTNEEELKTVYDAKAQENLFGNLLGDERPSLDVLVDRYGHVNRYKS